MPPYQPDTFESLTNDADGTLGFIFDNLSRIKHLDRLVKAKLDPTLQVNCRVINYRDNVLVIATNMAAWATRLKFAQHQLLSDLRTKDLPGLASISIVVLPNTVAKRVGLSSATDKNAKG